MQSAARHRRVATGRDLGLTSLQPLVRGRFDRPAFVHGAPDVEFRRSTRVVRFNEAGQAARIVVNHRPLGSVLLWSQLMGEHFAGTRYARYFHSHDAAEALHEATETR